MEPCGRGQGRGSRSTTEILVAFPPRTQGEGEGVNTGQGPALCQLLPMLHFLEANPVSVLQTGKLKLREVK